MKYNITRVCGCTDTIAVFGTDAHGERKRTIAAEEQKMCKECYLKSVVADNVASGMVALTGSEKQIAWAEQIRRGIVAKIEKTPSTNEESATTKEKVLNGLKGKTEAKWWIENREETIATIGRKILGIIPDQERGVK